MWQSLTKARSPEYHKRTMFKIVVAAVLLCLLWEPIRPVRQLTAQVMYSTADAIAR